MQRTREIININDISHTIAEPGDGNNEVEQWKWAWLTSVGECVVI